MMTMGVVGILEQDDFDTLEEYQKYLETHPKVQTRQSRVSANKNVKAAATLRYKIKGLTSTAAIQKTYIGSTYIYVLQRKNADTILSRCLINGTTATYQDEMVLKNFGHGQTLEWFEHNSKAYFGLHVKQMRLMILSGEHRLEEYNINQQIKKVLIIQKFQDFLI